MGVCSVVLADNRLMEAVPSNSSRLPSRLVTSRTEDSRPPYWAPKPPFDSSTCLMASVLKVLKMPKACSGL